MGLATFSFDVAEGSAARQALFDAVQQATGARKAWRLLTRQWMIQFATIADFQGFAATLEGLHKDHPDDFDYFALHFDPAGGPVVIAPNPGVRRPAAIPGAMKVANPAAAPAASDAAVKVTDPLPVLSSLRDLHAFDDWEARAAGPAVGAARDGAGGRPRARAARPGAGTRRGTGGKRGRAGRRR